jgi:hypothetical protein
MCIDVWRDWLKRRIKVQSWECLNCMRQGCRHALPITEGSMPSHFREIWPNPRSHPNIEIFLVDSSDPEELINDLGLPSLSGCGAWHIVEFSSGASTA